MRSRLPVLGSFLSGFAFATALATLPIAFAQTPTPTAPGKSSDLELVEKLIAARRDYQKTLEQLRLHYLRVGDLERAKWAEEELLEYHRMPRRAYRLELDVPPPNLSGQTNVPEANQLLARAQEYKNKFAFGKDYLDNQRRAEILLQELLTKYPTSTKISAAAYMLGEIYEGKVYRQYRRAAQYYERTFQWDPNSVLDARIKAARIYDRELNERPRAIELYREVLSHEHDTKSRQEAARRIQELSGGR